MKAFATAIGMAAFLAASVSLAAVTPGDTAPDFTLTDSNGKTVSLSDYAGEKVVLEWTNHQCPFVMKHYSSGNMQATQKAATEEGVVWLSIISSAPGKQGHVEGQEANALTETEGASHPRPAGPFGRCWPSL